MSKKYTLMLFGALTVLVAVIRWVWLLVLTIPKRRLTRKEWIEFVGLSLPLTGLGLLAGYLFSVF